MQIFFQQEVEAEDETTFKDQQSIQVVQKSNCLKASLK